jgi:dTMP kinase
MPRKKKHSPVLVVVEGLDGSGKSTLTEVLSDRMGATLLRTPPDQFRNFRPIIDSEYDGCGIAAQLFYASTVAFVSKKAEHLIARGVSVVVDRYWLSTYVYAQFRNESVDLSLLINRLLCPNLTVFLDLNDEERIRRMQKRGRLTPADLESVRKQKDLRKSYLQALDFPLVGRSLVIDTGKFDPGQCAEIVIQECQRKAAA